MKKKLLYVQLCAFVLLTPALSQPALAQDEGDSRFEEITVTATKRE